MGQGDYLQAELGTVPPADLEHVERQLISLLYALWRVQGKDKRIVKVENGGQEAQNDKAL